MHRRWIYALAGAVFVAQLVLAHVYCGFLTGDELEPLSEAFRVATDYKYEAWDARNTFVARFVIAPFLWLAAHLGITNRALLVDIATIPFALATAITILLVHKLALRWSGGDELAANVAAILFALHWLPLGFGSTTYPRVIAMICIAGAAVLVESKPWLAGLLMGIAFADRYSEAIYLAPLVLVAKMENVEEGFSPPQSRYRRGLKPAATFLIAAALSIAVTSGLYEWWLWGAPFHNLVTWTKLTILEGKISARATAQPPYWFLTNLHRWCALTMLPLLWKARKREPWLFVLLPLAALTLISHKELRFLQSIIPFLCILGGIGFAVWHRQKRNVAIALLIISIAWNLWGIRFLGKETKPAVEAARWLGAQHFDTIALGQVWAYGDRIYLGNEPRLLDVGTPIHSLELAMREAGAIAVFESDVTPEIANALATHGYTLAKTFRADRARDVAVFTAGGSAR